MKHSSNVFEPLLIYIIFDYFKLLEEKFRCDIILVSIFLKYVFITSNQNEFLIKFTHQIQPECFRLICVRNDVSKKEFS